MPVKFRTLFVIGVILTILAGGGPLVGVAILGGLWCAFYATNSVIIRFIVGAIVILTVGFPAFMIAGALWVILYMGYAVTGQLPAKPRMFTPEPQAAGGGSGTIIEAEWTEVRR